MHSYGVSSYAHELVELTKLRCIYTDNGVHTQTMGGIYTNGGACLELLTVYTCDLVYMYMVSYVAVCTDHLL